MRLSLGLESQHPAMPDHSTFSLLTALLPHLLLSATVFALLEKINKERFVINQTNQQTRKLQHELINSSVATLIVKADGKITFFNRAYQKLILDKVGLDTIPDNVYGLFEPDSKEMENLQFLLNEVFTSDKKVRDSQSLVRNVIEVRVRRKVKPKLDQTSSPVQQIQCEQT